jgi:hypothetical protein
MRSPVKKKINQGSPPPLSPGRPVGLTPLFKRRSCRQGKPGHPVVLFGLRLAGFFLPSPMRTNLRFLKVVERSSIPFGAYRSVVRRDLTGQTTLGATHRHLKKNAKCKRFLMALTASETKFKQKCPRRPSGQKWACGF